MEDAEGAVELLELVSLLARVVPGLISLKVSSGGIGPDTPRGLVGDLDSALEHGYWELLRWGGG